MLEHYFVKPSTLDRIRGSWLASPIERYVEWLETHGYARPTVVGRVPLLFNFADFAQKNGCTDIGAATAFVEAFVSQWLCQNGAGAKTSASLRKHKIYAESVVLQMLLLACEGCVKRNRHCHAFPLKSEAPGFADYLRNERGLNEITIYTYRRHLKEFAVISVKLALLRSASCLQRFLHLSSSTVLRGWLRAPVAISAAIYGFFCGSVTVRRLRSGISAERLECRRSIV